MAKCIRRPLQLTATPPQLSPTLLLPPQIDNPFSLYVGDLHPYVTEHDVYTLFSKIGPVDTVHLIRDRYSHKSLCHAYINFFLPVHAANALCQLNHIELRGKPIRVMWNQVDPYLRKTGIGNLFVKNLDLGIQDAKLEKVFGVFGRILSCKVVKDFDGKSKGFGYVQFDTEESASDALSALNGSVLNGKILTVAKYLRKSERKEPEFTNVYVKNLDADFTEISLKEKFSEYGKITSAVIMKDAEGKSKGFGFVNFESHENAKKAIKALNGAQIGTKNWFVGKAMRKAEREALLKRSHQKQKPCFSNLFVRNLAESVNEKDLRDDFGAFGNVTNARVICDKNGVKKGIAYVCFSRPEEANRAMKALNGIYYHGKYMNVTLALPEEEYAKHLQSLLELRNALPLPCKVPEKQVEKDRQNETVKTLDKQVKKDGQNETVKSIDKQVEKDRKNETVNSSENQVEKANEAVKPLEKQAEKEDQENEAMKSLEKQVQKEDQVIEASVSDDDLDGFVLVD